MSYIIPDKLYQVLKWVGLVVLPAVATLIQTVGTAAGWGGTDLTVTIVTAVGTFIGAILVASTVSAKPTDTEEVN